MFVSQMFAKTIMRVSPPNQRIGPSIIRNKRKSIKPLYDTNVLIDYVSLYTQYLCSSDSQTCFENIILPSINEQYDVVKTYMDTLHELKHIHDLGGVIFKLCIMHDKDALDALKAAVHELNNVNGLIGNIIDYAREQPILPEIINS